MANIEKHKTPTILIREKSRSNKLNIGFIRTQQVTQKQQKSIIGIWI